MTGQEKQPHDDIKRTLSLVAKVTLELAGLVQLVTWLVLTDYIITTSNQPSLDESFLSKFLDVLHV